MWKKWKTRHDNIAAALQLLCSIYCHIIAEKLWRNTPNLICTADVGNAQGIHK
jgi:hypothetical protein